MMSKIIAKHPCETISKNPKSSTEKRVDSGDSNITVNGKQVCLCQCSNNLNASNIAETVSEAIKGCNKSGKTTFKLQIEIINA